jgi:hypothetical protein
MDIKFFVVIHRHHRYTYSRLAANAHIEETLGIRPKQYIEAKEKES